MDVGSMTSGSKFCFYDRYFDSIQSYFNSFVEYWIQSGFIVGEGNLKARSFVDCLTNSGHYRLNRTYCSNEIIRASVRLPARVAVFYDDNETTLPFQKV